jgi:hypothetical protein
MALAQHARNKTVITKQVTLADELFKILRTQTMGQRW